jgi:small-conductance mechanosensitive channel
VLLWGRSTLKSLGIYQGLQEWFIASMEHTWTVGSLLISVNAIADFILVIIGTFIFLRIIIALLDLEIFPRLELPKGLPAAISMMVRYIFITLGVLLAVSAIGVDMGKFGILAGALGVGLGFGLQKIVANFISSLIIAFNRLIRVGDTVKYQDIMGNVTAVGVNASTVRKFDGAEVLIPNADLISNKVTNWTLSDNQRRMELPVKVAYGSDPHVVNQLLEKVAKWHPDVLPYPESFAIFNGFQEHFLDFTLYYWIPTSAYFSAKNEIALSVYDILRLHGIDTPRPQRDISMETLPAKKSSPPAKSVRSGESETRAQSRKKNIRK